MATAKTEKTQTQTAETYTVRLPLTKDNMDDVHVGINGEMTVIQRGVPVEVSAAVYEVLQNSERMDNEALMRQMELQKGIEALM